MAATLTPDTRAAAVERRRVATPRNVAQRTRMCCAVLCTTRERAADCAARIVLLPIRLWGHVASYASHALLNAVLLCTERTNDILSYMVSSADAAADK